MTIIGQITTKELHHCSISPLAYGTRTYVAVASLQAVMSVWEMRCSSNVQVGIGMVCDSVAFTPDGKGLATGVDKILSCWVLLSPRLLEMGWKRRERSQGCSDANEYLYLHIDSCGQFFWPRRVGISGAA